MLLRKCRHHFFNGGNSLFLNSLCNYSTATAIAQPQNGAVLADYLTKSLGFSEEAAFLTSNKVIRSKPIKDNALLVVNYFENLGMNKSQISSLVSSFPQLLVNDVDKTLEPKIRSFLELGLAKPDIVRVIMNHKLILVRGLDGFIRPRIEYFRKLFCTESTDRIMIAACKRYALRTYKIETVKDNVLYMQKTGLRNDAIATIIAKDPRNILFVTRKKFEDTIRRVLTDLHIPLHAPNFHYGMSVAASFTQANIEEKYEVIRSFGWSDEHIREMVRVQPLVLGTSTHRMRLVLDYYMNELGYSSEYLSSHPAALSFSLEKRVKPRNEVLKILNENKLNKSNARLYTLIIKDEVRFVKYYILPYKDMLPDMCSEYYRKVGKPKGKVVKQKGKTKGAVI